MVIRPQLFRWIALVLLLCMVGFSIYFSVGFRNKDKQVLRSPYGEILAYIDQNQALYPVTNIILRSGGCDVGYEELRVGNWSGTKAGCECSDGTFKVGTCASNNLAATSPDGKTCTDFAGAQLEAYRRWFNYFSVCVQRASDLLYVRSQDTCANGQRKCSARTCLKDGPDIACPLLDFKIVASTPDYTLPAEYEFLQRDLQDGDGKVVNTIIKRGSATNVNEGFIANVQSTFNGMPCITPTRLNQRSNNNNFPAESTVYEGCDTYGVDTANTITAGTLSEKSFLKSNMIYPKLPLAFQRFVDAQKDSFSLNNRLAIKTIEDLTCRQQNYVANGQNLEKSYKDLESIIVDCTLAIYAFGALAFCLVFYLLVQGSKKEARLIAVVVGVVLMMIAGIWIAQHIAVSRLYKFQRQYLKVLDNGCLVDEKFDAVLKEIHNKHNANYDFVNLIVSIMFYSGVVLVLLLLVLIILLLRAPKDETSLVEEEFSGDQTWTRINKYEEDSRDPYYY